MRKILRNFKSFILSVRVTPDVTEVSKLYFPTGNHAPSNRHKLLNQIIPSLTGWYCIAIDNVLLGIYVMEIVIKIYVWRKKFFKEGWNVLGM